MKTKLLLTLLGLSFAVSQAQNPIPYYFSAGSQQYALADSATPIDQSASGANAVYTFDQLFPNGMIIYNSRNTVTAEELQAYPNTNSVIEITSNVNGNSTLSNIFVTAPSSPFSFTGASFNGLDLNYNTNNATLGTFPLNYGYSNTDNTAGSFVYTTYDGTFTGTITTTVDAYGTMTMNDVGYGSYSGDVTRLKTVQNINLIYGFFGNVGTVVQTTYHYYDVESGVLAPIFKHTESIINVPLLSINQTVVTMESANLIILSTPKNSSIAFQIAPNPVTDFLTVQADTNEVIRDINITDINGRIVLQSNAAENKIDVSHLQSGIYFASIVTDKGTTTKKIIKK